MSSIIKNQLVNNHEISEYSSNQSSKNYNFSHQLVDSSLSIHQNGEHQQELSVEYVQKQIIQQLLMKSQKLISRHNVEQIQRLRKETEDRAYWAYVCSDQQYLANLYLQFKASQNMKEEVSDFVCEREDRVLSELMNGRIKCEKKLVVKKKEIFVDYLQIQEKSPQKAVENNKINHSIFQTQIDAQGLNEKPEKQITIESCQDNLLHDSINQIDQNKHENKNQQNKKLFAENSPQKLSEVYQFIHKLQEEKQQRLDRINKRREKQEQHQKQEEFEELEKLKKIREERREEFKKKLEKHNIQLKERQAQRRESDRQFKEFYKDYQQQKPLYTQMEEEFEEREKLYQKVQEVVILSQIKEQRKPLEKQNISQNHANNQQSSFSQQKTKSSKHIKSSINQSQHISIKHQDSKNNSNDDDKSQQIESSSTNVTPKRNIQKEKIYSSMVREMYAPKINQQKQIELNQQKEQINKFQNEKKFRQWKVIRQKQSIDQSTLENNLNSSFEAKTNQNSVQFNQSVDFMDSKESNMYIQHQLPNNKLNIKEKIRSVSTNSHTNKRYNLSNKNNQILANPINSNQNNIFSSNNQLSNPRQLKQSSQNDAQNLPTQKKQTNLIPLDLKQNHRQFQSQNSIDVIRTNQKIHVKNIQNSVDFGNRPDFYSKHEYFNNKEQNSSYVNEFLPTNILLSNRQQSENKSNQNIKKLNFDNNNLKNKQNSSVESLQNIQSDSQQLLKDLQNSKTLKNKNTSKQQQQTPLKQQVQNKQNQLNNAQKNENSLIHIMNRDQNLTPEKTNQSKQSGQNQKYFSNFENQKEVKLNIINSNEKKSFENFNIYDEDDQKVIDYLQELETRKLGNNYLQYSRKQINKKKIITPIDTVQETPEKGQKNLIAKSHPVSPMIHEKIKYANYLVHTNNANKIDDWQKDINNQKLSKEEQLNKVIIKTKNLDKKASQIETILKHNKNQFNNDEYYQQKYQLDQHYIQSIQAKLALLNKFSPVD